MRLTPGQLVTATLADGRIVPATVMHTRSKNRPGHVCIHHRHGAAGDDGMCAAWIPRENVTPSP